MLKNLYYWLQYKQTPQQEEVLLSLTVSVWSSPQIGTVTADVDKGQADVGNQIIANESKSNLPKERSVKFWINNIGDQSEEQE